MKRGEEAREEKKRAPRRARGASDVPNSLPPSGDRKSTVSTAFDPFSFYI